MNEELGINEFTAPSIRKIFEDLEGLPEIPEKVALRARPERPPMDRCSLALQLGGMMADGFVIVQCGKMNEVKPIALDLSSYAKAIGAGERVNRHAASLLKNAEDGDLSSFKNNLALIQSDVEQELASLRDSDMANLIGGFVCVKDIQAVQKLFLEEYRISKERVKEMNRRGAVQLDLDDLLFDIKKAEENGKNTSGLKSKEAKLRASLAKIDEKLAELARRIGDVRRQLDAQRAQYADDAEFARYEALRDEGIDLARLEYDEIRQLRRDLQLIFQDPYSSLNPRMTVGNIIGEGLLAHGFFKKNDERMQEYIIKTMEDAGLASYFLHRFPHQFSGGQRQRIGIARSLAVKPKFVVCDEAVSALDVSIQSQIINLLADLKEQSNLTYLFITHDLSVVKYISDRIGVMYLGNMVELANTQELFDHPLHPYTEALMAAIPTTDVEENRELRILEGDIPSPVNPPQGCKFHTRCAHCTEICKHAVPEWKEMAPGHFVACHHPLSEKE